MATPLYQQIGEGLRKQIDNGVLGLGSQLPTESELCEQYNASRNSVRDAIKWLMSQGLVETRPGQGTFVTQRTDPFVTALRSDPPTGFGGSYLRGELSGSFSLLDRITRNTIVVTGDESYDGCWQKAFRWSPQQQVVARINSRQDVGRASASCTRFFIRLSNI